jgi:uncharacterized membrane protein YgaE (UPF0421/DUF939 family)
MNLTHKRLLAVIGAVSAVLVSFNVLKPDQAVAVATLITAFAALYMPQENEPKP